MTNYGSGIFSWSGGGVFRRALSFLYFDFNSSVFCDPDGNVVSEGALVRNPRLGNFLEGIGEQGPDYLYNSSLTDIVVQEINEQGAPALKYLPQYVSWSCFHLGVSDM